MGQITFSDIATVTPTLGDIRPSVVLGGVPGAGRVLTEPVYRTIMQRAMRKSSYVVSGFTPPANGSSLTQSLGIGEAVIDGYYVSIPATHSITFPANTNTYCYIRLLLDGSQNVQSVVFETVDPGGSDDAIMPANSLPLWRVTTGASTVNAMPEDMRSYGYQAWGSVNFTTTRTVNSGSGNWYAKATNKVQFSSTWPIAPTFVYAILLSGPTLQVPTLLTTQLTFASSGNYYFYAAC